MELAEFILDAAPIAKLFPDVARALARRRVSGGPPRKQFEPFDVAQGRRYVAPVGGIVYGSTKDEAPDNAGFNQMPADEDAFFNQENAW